MRSLVPVLITALLLFASSLPCQAEITEYDIEIVIFEDLSNRYIDSEKWPRIQHAIPLQENSSSLITEELLEPVTAEYPDDNDVINIASNNSAMLDQHVKKLNNSSRYKVLVHQSWRQAGLDAESAIDIEVDSRKQQQPTTFQGIAADLPGSDNNSDNQLVSSVSGKVKITLGRYLHIYTDLIYKKPASFQAPMPVSLEDSRFSEFLIKSHRRMRSKELHYLDHPLVGMLVMALPVDSSAKNTPQQSVTQ